MYSSLQHVVAAIQDIRIPYIRKEYEIHSLIRQVLQKHGIDFKHEVKLAPRNRIDFLTNDGIGIEVKKGRPNEWLTIRQLERYALSERVRGIVLVVERYLDIPVEINGKPCHSVGLHKLWGISL